MKKFIPILSIVTTSVFMQNCANRDEDLNPVSKHSDEIKKTVMMRCDSANTEKDSIKGDPPVRDGDNWRLSPNN